MHYKPRSRIVEQRDSRQSAEGATTGMCEGGDRHGILAWHCCGSRKSWREQAVLAWTSAPEAKMSKSSPGGTLMATRLLASPPGARTTVQYCCLHCK